VADFRSLYCVNLLYVGRAYIILWRTLFHVTTVEICRDTAYVFLGESEHCFACGDICGELFKMNFEASA
jgi:hypothetical protein